MNAHQFVTKSLQTLYPTLSAILSEGGELLHLPRGYVLDPWREFATPRDLVEEDLLPCSEGEAADSHED